jgi:hypothetical protein
LAPVTALNSFIAAEPGRGKGRRRGTPRAYSPSANGGGHALVSKRPERCVAATPGLIGFVACEAIEIFRWDW